MTGTIPADALPAVEGLLGLPACPVPGHKGQASIGPGDDGALRLFCCTGRWRSLGEVRAAVAYGRDVQLSNIEISIRTRRLAYEAGVFPLATLHLPAVPTDTTMDLDAAADVTAAWEGFALLVGIRWVDTRPREVAFSSRFAVAWCPAPIANHARAAKAIRVLVSLGLLVRVGTAGGRTPLYVPRGYEGVSSGSPATRIDPQEGPA